MRKNRKGFTLVELLAVIVILGLLVALSVPLMMKYINYSKSKTYIQDANKLVSVAEYKINSNSLKIEKPDPDNCIILSYDYLNDGSIKNPPGKGTYLGSTSYVVVKNDGGKLDYSVALIEEAKDGGYSGVKLSSLNQINGAFGFSRVDGYKEENLVYINKELCTESCINTNSREKLAEKKKDAKKRRESVDNVNLDSEEVAVIKDSCNTKCESATMLNSDIINEYVANGGEYIKNIEKIYTEDELEQGSPGNAFAPKIVSAYVENGEINPTTSEILMKVNVVASDEDSPTSLRVCIKHSDTDDFTAADDTEYCGDYISGNLFVKEYLFKIDPTDPDKGKFFYITVTDEKMNSTSTKISKKFTKNKPPVVEARVDKLAGEKCNTNIAEIHTSFSDDRDLVSDLMFCINQSEECLDSDYLSRDTFFSGEYGSCDEHGNNCIYKYKLGNENVLDGKSYQIYLHVKDKNDEVTTTKMDYQVSELKSPIITFSLNPSKVQINNDIPTIYNDFNGYYVLNIDQNSICSKKEDIKLEFRLPDNSETKMTYAQYLENDNNKKFSFLADYDGHDRVVNLNLKGNFGEEEHLSTVLNNVYTDVAPVIETFSVDSDPVENCSNYCEAGDSSCDTSCIGNNVVKVNVSANDDLDANSLQYCLSEDKPSCDVDSNFLPLSEFSGVYSFVLRNNNPYNLNDSNRTLYLTVKDRKEKTYAELDYKIYVNKPPTVSGEIKVVSTDDNKNISEVSVDTTGLSIFDDFDSYTTQVCYRYGGNDICKELSDIVSLTYGDDNPIIDSTVPIPIYIKVIDNYGESVVSDSFEYQLSKNNPPEIKQTFAKSVEEEFNSNVFDVYFKVYDPFDTYSICLSDNSSAEGCEFKGSYNGADNKDLFDTSAIEEGGEIPEGADYYVYTYNSGWDYTTDKELYLHVSDSANNVVSKKVAYDLYNMCSNKIIVDHIDYEFDDTIAGNEPINYKKCEGKCYKDDNPFSSKYNLIIKYEDRFLGNSCPDGKVSNELYCDFPLCAASAVADESIVYILGKTLIPVPEGAKLEEEHEGIVYTCTGYYRLYVVDILDNYIEPHEREDEYQVACAELVGTKYIIGGNSIVIDDTNYGTGQMLDCSDPEAVDSEPCMIDDEDGD